VSPTTTAQEAEAREAAAAAGRPLPRRPPGRPPGRLWAIRTPIPPAWRRGLIAASVLVPLLAWVSLSASGVVPGKFLPSPLQVGEALVEMARSGQLVDDALISLQRVGIGFGLAVLVSVPLGLLIGSFQAGRALFEPVIGLLRYMPASAFIPLLIIWLGLGEPSKVALLVIGVVFFNTLMTADAVRLVPADVIDVAYTLGARRGEVLRTVVIPHALPAMIDAMRVNAAAAWNFVVVAELIASTSGLGYRIVRSQRFLETDKIFAVLLVIGLIGLSIDVGLRLLRQRVGRWQA
jgi:NitT/TauT family transport system permease protein